MVPKIIDGIVGGADDLNAKLLQDALRRQLTGQCSIRCFPNRRSRSLVQQLRNSEVALQLEMRPVVQRIAQRVRNGSRPGQKLLVGRSVPGNVFFRHAVRAHRPPFIVVSLKPDLVKIGESPVLSNVSRGKMAVIIENRLRSGKLVIEVPCRIVR